MLFLRAASKVRDFFLLCLLSGVKALFLVCLLKLSAVSTRSERSEGAVLLNSLSGVRALFTLIAEWSEGTAERCRAE